MNYRRDDDQLFGKYCYIDTPWIAGEKTIYRIIRSGVRSNAWCEVPVRGRNEIVTHDRYEDIVFVVLDTLIDENTKIKRFALKDVEIIEVADRKTESSSEKPNNFETCKYWKYIAREWQCETTKCQGYTPKTEPTGYNLSPVEDEPQTGCPWK